MIKDLAEGGTTGALASKANVAGGAEPEWSW